MKTIIQIITISSALFASSGLLAADRPTQNELLTQCKTVVASQFSDIKAIKLAKIRQSRGNFEAKFRVSADGERGVYTCSIPKNASTAIVRNDNAPAGVAGGE